MNILFLTLSVVHSLEDRTIYMDLMNIFAEHGHQVYIVSPLEKKYHQKTREESNGNVKLLRVKTGNLFGVGMLEKGISQICLARQYTTAIEMAWKDICFELILYSTPPITLAGTIRGIKKRTHAKTYLLLKDIFPQNAVDIGILNKHLANLLFRRKERQLYQISDYIGCMSAANVAYLLTHNRLEKEKVEICPNTIRLENSKEKENDIPKEFLKEELCKKYGLPKEKVWFLYGGNLGKPQGIPHLLRCIESVQEKAWAHFIVCGTGTELPWLQQQIKEKNYSNMTLIPGLPHMEYEELASGCDVGMIFLDYRFTIPNFPSRLLSYMEKGLPVLTCTDRATDIGQIVEENQFGRACFSNDIGGFGQILQAFQKVDNREYLGKNSREYLEKHYTAEEGYQIIIQHFL